jgi:crossover junction endodeoxyribonuclease RusA
LITLELTYPPSSNHYWTHWAEGQAVRMAVGSRGMAYRAEALRAKLENRIKTLEGRLDVQIEFWMPDRRKRDIDNPVKCLFDAFNYAKIWNDDEQVDSFHVLRIGVEKPGKTTVCIREI